MTAPDRTIIVFYLMRALKADGSWCGETHIQKTLYVGQSMLNVPSHFKFILYKHGPYSFQLSEYLQELIADEFVYVRPRRPPYGPSLELSEDAISVAKLIPTESDLAKKLDFITTRLGSKGVGELERLATAVYVNEKHGSNLPLEQRIEILTDLKPHVSSDKARNAFIEVDQILNDSQLLNA